MDWREHNPEIDNEPNHSVQRWYINNGENIEDRDREFDFEGIFLAYTKWGPDFGKKRTAKVSQNGDIY